MSKLKSIFSLQPKSYIEGYCSHVGRLLQQLDTRAIQDLIEDLLTCRASKKKIFVAGNGGSASTASHFANDLLIGTKQHNNPFQTYSLSDNLSIVTALANDYGYDTIFAKQIEMLGEEGDLIIVISASGNSPNILNALSSAQENKIKSWALLGFDGGKAADLADRVLHCETEYGEYGPVEDVHLMINHIIVTYLQMFLSTEARE